MRVSQILEKSIPVKWVALGFVFLMALFLLILARSGSVSSERWPSGAGHVRCGEREVPAGEDWLNGSVSLKGGELTKPCEAYEYAKAQGYTFVADEETRDELIADGVLEKLEGPYMKLDDVSEPYVLPIVKQFVERLSQQYVAQGCGELWVTSALRLTTRQPKNASRYSVHPTGMAVDFRVPAHAWCRKWLTARLSAIEADQRLDATREHGPAHLHAVVVTKSYEQYLMERPIDPVNPELRALTLALYNEGAIAEPREGLVAIAAVIKNRVRSKSFPDTILAVTAEGAAGKTKGGCQFSYMCDGHLEDIELTCRIHPRDMATYWGPSWWDRLRGDKRTPCQHRWYAMQDLAEDLIDDDYDPTNGAVLYYAGKKPYWAKGGETGHGDLVPDSIQKIGNHTFGQSRLLGRDIAPKVEEKKGWW
jgi:spore germination cell wall hydrolase CwlJ-like protein